MTPKPSPPVLPARASHPAVPCRAVVPQGERSSRSARLLGASPNPPPRFVISTRFTGGERWGEGWKGGCQRSAPARLAKKSTSLSSPAPRSRGPARPRAPRGPSPPPPYQLPSQRSHNLAKPRPDTPHGRAPSCGHGEASVPTALRGRSPPGLAPGRVASVLPCVLWQQPGAGWSRGKSPFLADQQGPGGTGGEGRALQGCPWHGDGDGDLSCSGLCHQGLATGVEAVGDPPKCPCYPKS